MRVNYLFFTFLLIISKIPVSYAQTILVGPRAGMYLSQIKGLTNGRTRAGTAVGGFVSFIPTNHVGFSADIIISAKGARTFRKINTSATSEVWDTYSNLVYLDVPLLLNVYLGNKEKLVRPKIFAGPAFSFKLNATESMKYRKDEMNGTDSTFTSNSTISKNFKKSDLGAIVGFGFDYKMGNKTFFNFDARYSLGLIDIKNSTYPNSLYNRNLAFFVGIAYFIGK